MPPNCTQCGAPLDNPVATTDANVVKCRFCGTAQPARTRETRQQAGFSLRGTKPPLPLVLRLPLAFLFLLLGLGLIWFKYRWLFQKDDSNEVTVTPLETFRRQTEAPQRTWDGLAPFRCDGNEEISISNVVARLPDRTAVTVSGNCSVKLVNVQIVAYEGVRADGNGSVTLENSRIEADQVGVWADGNKRIELIGSNIVAGGSAIRAGTNVSVILTQGRVEGRTHALELSLNADADVRGTELVGEIQRSRNGTITGIEPTKRARNKKPKP